MITFAQMTNTLQQMDWPFEVLLIGLDTRLIVTAYGARIFGPFFGELPSLSWINSAWESADLLRAFIDGSGWNLGGERVWIAPEFQFIIQDRYRPSESYRVPGVIEPGNYQITHADHKGILLKQNAAPLTVYNSSSALNNGGEMIWLSMDRRIQPVNNTIAPSGLLRSVWYRQTVRIARDPVESRQPVQAWNLFQLHPGGMLVIPCAAEAVGVDYFGVVMDEANSPRDGAFRIPITGTQQYKSGYSAQHVKTPMAYLNRLAGTDYFYLLIRVCTVDLSRVYAEEPPHQPGVDGQAVFVYDDGGRLGGFGEMEVSGYSIQPGESSVTTDFNLMAYLGREDDLKQVAEALLGVRWDR